MIDSILKQKPITDGVFYCKNSHSEIVRYCHLIHMSMKFSLEFSESTTVHRNEVLTILSKYELFTRMYVFLGASVFMENHDEFHFR